MNIWTPDSPLAPDDPAFLSDEELDALDRELAAERGVVLPADEEIWAARRALNAKHYALEDQRNARRRAKYHLTKSS